MDENQDGIEKIVDWEEITNEFIAKNLRGVKTTIDRVMEDQLYLAISTRRGDVQIFKPILDEKGNKKYRVVSAQVGMEGGKVEIVRFYDSGNLLCRRNDEVYSISERKNTPRGVFEILYPRE
jgi:hypothetical protein